MKREVVAIVILFLKIYLCKTETAIYGENKELNCNIRGTKYEWHKRVTGGFTTLYQSTDPIKYAGTASTQLTIKSITWSDNGEYRCRVFTPSNFVSGEWIQLSVTGSWNIWSGWSVCSVSCGTGLIQRTRICTSGSCTGDPSETSECTINCEVDGGWSSWNNWEACTVTCGTGQQNRRRYCNNPLPAQGGDSCQGGEDDDRECTLGACPVDGGWSSWNNWEACTVTCGTGQQQRRRYCDNPLPAHGGDSCQGGEYDNRECTLGECPVDGGWSSWTNWEACTVTCGTGQQLRRRDCDNPLPAYGGDSCQGREDSDRKCTLAACPIVNGGWSSWTYGACNATCGTGQQRRRRYCSNPLKANGGADCQGEEDDLISCASSECAEQQSENMSIVVGTVIGVLFIVILILILVMFLKRRWYNQKKEPDYEITDMKKVEGHIYGETHVNHIYQNDKQTTDKEVTVTDSKYIDEVHLVDRYDVADLTKRYTNKEYFLQTLRAEFKLLNDSTDDPKSFNSQYEIVDTGLRQDVNQLTLNSPTLNVLNNNNVSILLEVPQKNCAEKFWTIVDDHGIETIILLVQENEKVTEFYPTIDEVFRMKTFEIYLDSAERKNKNVKLLTFNLENKTTLSMRQIKMFKTNVWESPPVKGICFITHKASEMRCGPVLIINSKMADLSVCGVLAVCLNVIFAIRNGNPFSVMENARMVNKNNRRFFKDFDDYALCYKVIKHYLENVHTYDCTE